MAKKETSYQDSLNELESIISKIETGEVEIDELSSLVKRAAELIKTCKTKLRNTEADLNQFLDSPHN